LATKTDALLADEAPIYEIDELRPLIAEGQERGTLTVEQIAASLEEAEVTKEQIAELHAYLLDQGIEIVTAEGKPVTASEPEACPPPFIVDVAAVTRCPAHGNPLVSW